MGGEISLKEYVFLQRHHLILRVFSLFKMAARHIKQDTSPDILENIINSTWRKARHWLLSIALEARDLPCVRGCLPFIQKIRKFRLQFKWQD